MSKLSYILIFSAIMQVTSSCEVIRRSSEKHVEHVTHSYIDSTYYSKTQLLDTAFIAASLASDSINLELLKELGRFNIDNDRAHTTIVYDKGTGKIHVDTKCDAAFKAYIKSTYEQFARQITSDIETKINQQLKAKQVIKQPFKSWLNGFIAGVITLCVIYLAYWLYSKYSKTIKSFIPWTKK